jgi:hypothetical protein
MQIKKKDKQEANMKRATSGTLTFAGLQGVIFQNIEFFITTTVRT